MNISITARGGKASDRLKKYIMDKLSKKPRVYEGVIDTEVVLSYEKLTQIVEIKVKVFNGTVIVREKSDDIFKSIDLAVDNCERQIIRFKEKRRDHKNEKMKDRIAV
jgi:ribosome hibernation promoting factor